MNKLLAFCAIILLLPCCKWAFQKIVQTVQYVSRYDNGVAKKEGSLTEGLQTGDWTFFYEDGRKRAQGKYQNDVQVGAWTSWYENGRTEWRGHFDTTGHRTGLWTFHFNTGERRAEGRFRDDFETGPWTFWNQAGQLTQRGDFLEARRVGLWTDYHPSGSKQAEGLMYDGQRAGPWRLWTASGEESSASYELPPGRDLVLDTWPDGAPRRTGLIRAGTPVGGWVTWHQDRNVRMSCVFSEGAPVAGWAAFRQDGTELADGYLTGKDLDHWRTFENEAWTSQERTPLPQIPPISADQWSAAALAAGAPAADVVAQWLAEIRSPATAAATPPPAITELPPAAPEQVAELPADPRVPASKQPDWTVLESEEIDSYVQEYLVGEQPKKKGRAGRYAIPKSKQGKPRRRADLEGREFPIEELTATDGTVVKLADYRGKRRVLTVVLRGFAGQVCVYCVAQTEALAQCYNDFQELNLEVLVIYPGPEGNEKAFLQAYEETFGKKAPPYRVFYDPDLKLVKRLDIEGGDLAYPTTIFIDENGTMQWAYTGAHRADRPAAQEIIKFIRSLKS